MKLNWVTCGAIVVMVMSSRPVHAQCGGGGSPSSSHDHGGYSKTENAPQPDKIIQSLLAEKQSRHALMEAVLTDPPFMREMIVRILEQPEWRALAAERLGLVPSAPAAAPAVPPATQPSAPPSAVDDGKGPAAPKVQKALYRCQMHPEVTSSQPGRCWKCGMSLVRVS
ncbi:MAG: hypothetical protein HYX75_24475 [Acidobacteria bacterium]|nr:hypothetical protein [Acidobacteriota bacterium]